MTGISFEVKKGAETLNDLESQMPVTEAAMIAYDYTSETVFLSGSAVNSLAFMSLVTLASKASMQHMLEHCPPRITKYDQILESSFVYAIISSMYRRKGSIIARSRCSFKAGQTYGLTHIRTDMRSQ